MIYLGANAQIFNGCHFGGAMPNAPGDTLQYYFNFNNKPATLNCFNGNSGHEAILIDKSTASIEGNNYFSGVVNSDNFNVQLFGRGDMVNLITGQNMISQTSVRPN